jgi:NAD(P)-dependent dehydrogenase (short-subunit alcohol dehydrogenase family)
MTLQGRVAIVTGGGRGIGRAVALTLASAGCRVVLAARSGDQLELVQDEVTRSGGKAICVPTDLSQDDQIGRLVERTLSEYSTIDILVNNAGWGKKSSVVTAKVEDWDQTFKVNLRAPMLLSRLVLPTLIEKKSGAVINIGSISGKSAEANASAYAASKFGLIGFTQALYQEVREYGIKVTVLLPGFVDTPLIPPVKHLDRTKMIRAEDVAEAVMFVLNSSETCCPTEMTIQPQRTPYK